MDKSVELAIRMTADASDVSRSLDDVGSSARAMADDVSSAARTTEDATRGLDAAADSADELGSKTSQAAGGLGDLGGALSVMPGPLGALGSGMEAAAPAIQGVTGAADLANLALSSNVVQNTRAALASIRTSVATKAQATAAKVAAAGQWLLNAALAANPVGLVIIAVIALVAAVVLAYRKSETFRAIVQAVMAKAREAVATVIRIVTDLVGWIKDKAPAAWERLKGSAVAAADYIRDKVGAAFDKILAPIRAAIDLVQSLLDKIGSIDFPDMPDLGNPFGNPFNNRSSTTLGRPSLGLVDQPAATGTTIDARTYITIDGTGIVDEAAVARALEPVLARNAMRLGQVTAAPAW